MRKYAILANPGHSRVYFEASMRLSLAELEICVKGLCHSFGVDTIGGVPYFTLETDGEFPIDIISRLSFAYAVFELLEYEGKTYLQPVEKTACEFFNQSVSNILKYPGKTNELFTRLMINVAVGSGYFEQSNGRLALLDPVCGKGTTLFEGLVCGHNVYGIEIGPNVVHEAAVYFKKYLETEKYKHSFVNERLSGENKSFTSKVYKYELSKDKNAPKLNLTLVAGNSKYADNYFRKGSMDIIVGDLPYGVAHGNVTNEKQSSLTRNPSELLSACLPSWCAVLKKGGIIVLAWNKFVLTREALEKILSDNGFAVFSGNPYDKFEHMVDRAIKRDIIVAEKL